MASSEAPAGHSSCSEPASCRAAAVHYSPFTKAPKNPVRGACAHSVGMLLYAACLITYVVQAVLVWAEAPVAETFSVVEAKEFGPLDLEFEISCPSCVQLQSPNLTDGAMELWRVWHGYDSAMYPHCTDATENRTVDASLSNATLCYSSDDIAEASGIVVSLWNMTTGGQGNRANVIVRGASMVVTTPLEWWHEKTLLLGLKVTRDAQDCTSATACNLKRELYLGSMQYDGRVQGWPGARLNLRLLRMAQVYTRLPGQTIWDVLGAVGGANGLLMTLMTIIVSGLEKWETKRFAESAADAANTAAMDGAPSLFGRLPWSDSNNCLVADASTGSGIFHAVPSVYTSGMRDITRRQRCLPHSVRRLGGDLTLLCLPPCGAECRPKSSQQRLEASVWPASLTSDPWIHDAGLPAVGGIGFICGCSTAHRPSTAKPASGALSTIRACALRRGATALLTPPTGFELMASVPRTSRGVLVQASATCVGESVFLGVDYSFSQCEAACSQRSSCEFFRVGIGDRSGECIQESTGDGSAPCQELQPDDSFSVYRVTPTGNCYRFLLTEDGAQRNDVDCSLEQHPAADLPGQGFGSDPDAVMTVAVFGLRIGAPALAVEKLYIATLAMRNPMQMPEQSVWTLQSFSQTLLVSEALLEDASADGFALLAALDRLELQVLPEAERHKAFAAYALGGYEGLEQLRASWHYGKNGAVLNAVAQGCLLQRCA
ncbi:unnamed protein product [Symbiodinium natans]|uniref:Uncharacterized protein n=1 Tax=Symbiodinium natans TaxID=878477 RepID=A0A812JUC7_9DINO|nr:unnamed protein product [Symbiodinium natans]